jgi:hypothetical protein
MREQTLLNWVLLSENEKTANGKECLCKPVHVPTAVCVPDRDPVRAKQNCKLLTRQLTENLLLVLPWTVGQPGLRVGPAHNTSTTRPQPVFVHALGFCTRTGKSCPAQ